MKYLHFSFAIILFIGLASCDTQKTEPFSVDLKVENEDGKPVGGAEVSVRPCYETACTAGASSVQSGLRTNRKELSSFEASSSGSNSVSLRWKVSGSDIDGLWLQRKSESDEDFERLSSFDVKVEEVTTYQYEDSDLISGTYRYRVSIVYTGGNLTTSPVISVLIRNNTDITKIKPIYPNPFSGQTNIVLKVGETSTG